ncbi:hypothetical protein P9112_012294 [Eukaryota sp. TZLM1-RC]
MWNASLVAALAVFNDEQYNVVLNRLHSDIHPCASVFIVAFSSEERFPVNSLRNLAMSAVKTDNLINLDVDIIPFAQGHTLETPINTVTILPAFELHNLLPVPITKEEVIFMFRQEQLVRFKNHCFNCHGMTNFEQWFSANEYYEVDHKSENAEPYFVISAGHAPRFDERFCYGYRNRVSNVYEIAQKFGFRVHPHAWLLHLPHDNPPFNDRLSFGCPGVSKPRLDRLWNQFKKDLSENK